MGRSGRPPHNHGVGSSDVDHPDSNVDLDTVADWMSEQGLGEDPQQ
jgi:hypothetical protein